MVAKKKIKSKSPIGHDFTHAQPSELTVITLKLSGLGSLDCEEDQHAVGLILKDIAQNVGTIAEEVEDGIRTSFNGKNKE